MPDMALESRFVQRHRMGGEQGLVAFAAIGLVVEVFGGQPVGGVAVRADDVLDLAHGGGSSGWRSAPPVTARLNAVRVALKEHMAVRCHTN